MKPLKLTMTAFGPYINRTSVDFEHELGDEKIFLIHGATGAGKTTILDAISYALYGETSGKERDVKDMRSKGVADDVLTEVEFTFALGDKIFKVRREISYHPNRKDNKFQKQAILFCDGNPIETRESTVKNKITELLGFNADQFRQVVILPQGKFKEFLFADADDRQEILNVLFDSEPYKKIEDALGERAKVSVKAVETLKTRREELERQIGGAESTSMQDTAAKLLATQAKVDALKKISDAAQTKLTDGKILSGKFSDAKNTATDLQEAKKLLEEADTKFSAAQTEYRQREAEESERKNLEQQVRDFNEIKSARKDFQTKSDALEKAKTALKTADDDFANFDGKAKYYEKLLEERKTQKAAVAGADVEFNRVENLLNNAKKRDGILREIARLEASLEIETEKLAVVAEKLQSAQIELNRLQIVHNAAYLATKLKDGEPCPVCGSLEHPKIIAEAIPTAAELQSAEKSVAACTKENSQQERTVAQIKGQISTQKNSLKDYVDVPDTASVQESHDAWQKKAASLKKYEQAIEKGEGMIRDNKSDLDKATTAQKSAAEAVARLEGELSEAKKKIPEKYLSDAAQLDADLSGAQKKFNELDAAWKNADKNFRDADRKKSSCAATLQSVQKKFDELQNYLADKTPPDLPVLERNAAKASDEYGAAITEKAKLESTLDTLKKYLSDLEQTKKDFVAAEKIADMWRRLSDVANGTGRGESELKISFQRYFLSTMFNDVVTEANNRLKKMSNGRYLFHMKDAGKTKSKTAGLNLEIFDEYSGSLRPVETLSGGESFLASLALALGLAAVVRNNLGGIKLDTIFIDEGFGSLDTETLDFALKTLMDLQSGGRLVGIISHVEELKNQMPVRLEVTSGKTGSTAEFKHGSARD